MFIFPIYSGDAMKEFEETERKMTYSFISYHLARHLTIAVYGLCLTSVSFLFRQLG